VATTDCKGDHRKTIISAQRFECALNYGRILESGIEPIMQNAFQRRFARLVVGSRDATLHRMVLAARYARLFDGCGKKVLDRFSLYDLVGREVIGDRAFDYLEFGVYKGESISYIAAHNTRPDARFWGFDSFEGLPVEWNEHNPKGTFDVGGNLPTITDTRVRFIKGWFDTTVPEFLKTYGAQGQLWIHIDADLYGSTIQVLTFLNRHIRAGTVIMFDEIEDLENEFKALCDFEAMSDKRLSLLAATEDCRQAAFVCE
jgi:hypothetical protein